MMRKPLIQNILLSLLALTLGLVILEGVLRAAAVVIMWQRDKATSTSQSESNQFVILCVGESTTYCGDHSYAYPRQLGEILSEQYPERNFQVVNKGKPGCNTAYIAASLPDWLDKYRPDLVIAMMGINDSRQRLLSYDDAEQDPGFWKSLRVYKVFSFAWQNLRNTLRSGFRKMTWDAEDYVSEGDRLLEAGDDEEAASMFFRARDLDPGWVPAHVGLARYYMHRQDFKRVMKECARALEGDPGNDQAMTIMGRACMEKKRWEEGAAHLEKAISVNPFNSEALGALAWCYYWKQKRFKEAEDLAFRALRWSPTTIWRMLRCGTCTRKRVITGALLKLPEGTRGRSSQRPLLRRNRPPL